MIRGVVEARRSARINARACDDRMAALAGVVVLQGYCLQVNLRWRFAGAPIASVM